MASERLSALLDALSPARLREQFSLPHNRWREEYVPRLLLATSYEAMMEELSRFVAHLEERWFGGSIRWPSERSRFTAIAILRKAVGDDRDPRSGEFMAMRMCRHGDQGGLRRLLDMMTETLLRQRLAQYLEAVVLARIYNLAPSDSIDLARQYARIYGDSTGMATENPGSIAMRWREVIHKHASMVLFRS